MILLTHGLQPYQLGLPHLSASRLGDPVRNKMASSVRWPALARSSSRAQNYDRACVVWWCMVMYGVEEPVGGRWTCPFFVLVRSMTLSTKELSYPCWSCVLVNSILSMKKSTDFLLSTVQTARHAQVVSSSWRLQPGQNTCCQNKNTTKPI